MDMPFPVCFVADPPLTVSVIGSSFLVIPADRCFALLVVLCNPKIGGPGACRFPTTHAGPSGVSPWGLAGGFETVAERPPQPPGRLERRSLGDDGSSRGALGAQDGDLGLEVLGRLERAVDAREAEVGHLVELPQRPEDGQADLVSRHLRPSLAAQGVLDRLAQAGELVLGDRAALARLADAGDRLVPGEGLGRAGALEDRQLHLLDGGEPLGAVVAGTTAADRAAVVGDAGVEHTGVGVAAVRTVHVRASPLARPAGSSGRDSDTPPGVSTPVDQPVIPVDK
jgi:hypothetical protein